GAILLQSGADIFLTNKQGESPLKLAFTKGDSRERWMLTPETVGRTDINGCTVLHYAASWGMYRIIPLIVQQGGKVNVKNTRGETPLVSAVKTDNAETVRALFETETMGGEPLDSYSRDFLGDTALHTAVGWRALGAAEVVLQKTRDSGLLIGAKNAAGKTALHVAAQHGDIPFLNLLLAYGADVNIEDREGKTPLIDALLYDKNTTVLFLLKAGASSARQDIQGRTALHEAVASAPPIIIQELRQAGADPLARDSFGNTPLALVLRSGRPILDVLLGNNSLITNSDGDTPLHIAVQENADFDILRYLILKGYPINKRNRMGITALTLAAKQGAAELCAVLIDSGADVFAAD
ncbi:MAG: ankyrin repeat domain-containing protein, partial [Treponema sp.]